MRFTGALIRRRVADLDAATAFYEGLVGSRAHRFAFSGAQLAAVGPFLLFAADGDSGDRLARVAGTLTVDDLDACATRLTDLGARLVAPPTPTPNGRRLIARHPDGAVFEYTGPGTRPADGSTADAAVRCATASDEDAIWPLVVAFATSYEPERAAFASQFARVHDDPNALLAVADATDGGLAGYLLATRHAAFHANAPVVWVEEVMVDPARRRRGTGAALMAAADGWAVESGAAYLALATRRAAQFYLSLGFAESAGYYRRAVGRG